MSRYVFPFKDYYKQSFVDPLYAPYTKRKELSINPYTMNLNEIKYNRGLDFKKKYSEYPCPMGFKNIGDDYCSKFSSQIPFFYSPFYKNIVDQDIPLKDFTDYKITLDSVYSQNLKNSPNLF
jgi:hypothetical protein